MDELMIEASQVVYGESNKHYCSETKEQVSHFQAVNRAKLLGTRVLHDAGNAFKLDGEYILAC